MNPSLLAWRVAYEISPIFFVNGIANELPGKTLPIAFFTEELDLINGALTGDFNLSYENAAFHFKVVPGATLLNASTSSYPYANQTVAVNAMQNDPLRVSLHMICAERRQAGMLLKTLKLSSLKSRFEQHQQLGGYYNVLTPAFFYSGSLLTNVRDVTSNSGNNGQSQNMFQLDFEQPLVKTDEAANIFNNLLSLMSSGCKAEGGLPEINWLKNGSEYAKKWL